LFELEHHDLGHYYFGNIWINRVAFVALAWLYKRNSLVLRITTATAGPIFVTTDVAVVIWVAIEKVLTFLALS